jgi:hypothetical protein
MRKLCVLLSLALASSAMASISFTVVPDLACKASLDAAGPGFATSEFFVYNVRFALTTGDDWTSTHATVTSLSDPDFLPRAAQLKAPVNPDPDMGDPPLTAAQACANMASTPNDYPNDLTPGSPSSSLATVGTTVSTNKLMDVTWFDTTTNNGVTFTGFRVTLRQLKEMDDLTLDLTPNLIATYASTTTTVAGGGSLTAFAFNIYRVPEPHTLSLLALGGLAALIRRR